MLTSHLTLNLNLTFVTFQMTNTPPPQKKEKLTNKTKKTKNK